MARNEQDAPMDVPEIYCDGVQIGISPYTAILSLTLQPPAHAGQVPPARVANVRMSLQHAKVMAIVLRKQIKTFEAQQGIDIQLPQALYQTLSISKQEDW